MKNSKNMVSNLKTAGVVAGLSFTLSACNGNINQSENSNYTEISNKTDSILQRDPMYRLSLNVNDCSRRVIDKYRDANKSIVRKCAKKYITKNITDKLLCIFMLRTLQNSSYEFGFDGVDWSSKYVESTDVSNLQYISRIRRDYRWFNDVMMYLAGQYNDVQFLKTDFFKLINDKNALSAFNKNLQEIQRYQQLEKSSNTELVSKYTQVWHQQVKEQAKSKQR